MLTPRVGLNLVTVKNGQDADCLEANLKRARSAGFQGVGLWVSTLRQWLDSGRSLAELIEQIHGLGLELHELCFVPVLDEAGKVADQSRVFEWARTLGAGAVICLYGDPDRPLEQAREDWAAFVEKTAPSGVPAAFEFIGPWPRYNGPAETWEVIQAGPELGTMVFDTFHFWRGGGDLGQLESIPPRRVSLVHLNDVKDVPRERAVDADRTFPGEGVMPLRDILRALIRAGFEGPLSVEIFGEAQQQDPDEVSARAYRSAAALLEAL